MVEHSARRAARATVESQPLASYHGVDSETDHLFLLENMLIHTVYFWLKDGITPTEVATFETGVRSLLTIDSVVGGYVGKPADTVPRPIIDRSYSYGLVAIFDDLAGHDAYQVDPIHDAFRSHASLWKRVQIYDMSA
jgi:Stress responsive A/B Barrel Domain